MFEGFAKVWTPIELSRRVRLRPVALTVAGERVVLFRDANRQIAALIDRCPHRSVALSLGKRTSQGTLECPFHGWQFEASGRCVRVPLNPDAKCELLGATALPVREHGGLIWLYTAPVAVPSDEPIVPEALGDDSFCRFYLIANWKTHFSRAMENMLDMPHVPFVHKRTIGFAMRRRLRPDSRLAVTYTATEHGGRIESTLDGVPSEGALEFLRPNGMMLHIPVPGKRMRIHVYCVPVGPKETRMIIVSARNFGHYNPFVHLFDQVNRLIVLEDQAIVESSDPAEIPPPGVERSVASDRPTLLFRKYYYEVLRESSATPAPKDERLVQLIHKTAPPANVA